MSCRWRHDTPGGYVHPILPNAMFSRTLGGHCKVRCQGLERRMTLLAFLHVVGQWHIHPNGYLQDVEAAHGSDCYARAIHGPFQCESLSGVPESSDCYLAVYPET